MSASQKKPTFRLESGEGRTASVLLSFAGVADVADESYCAPARTHQRLAPHLIKLNKH